MFLPDYGSAKREAIMNSQIKLSEMSNLNNMYDSTTTTVNF